MERGRRGGREGREGVEGERRGGGGKEMREGWGEGKERIKHEWFVLSE